MSRTGTFSIPSVIWLRGRVRCGALEIMLDVGRDFGVLGGLLDLETRVRDVEVDLEGVRGDEERMMVRPLRVRRVESLLVERGVCGLLSWEAGVYCCKGR